MKTVRCACFAQRRTVVQKINQAGRWFGMDREPAPGVGGAPCWGLALH